MLTVLLFLCHIPCFAVIGQSLSCDVVFRPFVWRRISSVVLMLLQSAVVLYLTSTWSTCWAVKTKCGSRECNVKLVYINRISHFCCCLPTTGRPVPDACLFEYGTNFTLICHCFLQTPLQHFEWLGLLLVMQLYPRTVTYPSHSAS